MIATFYVKLNPENQMRKRYLFLNFFLEKKNEYHNKKENITPWDIFRFFCVKFPLYIISHKIFAIGEKQGKKKNVFVSSKVFQNRWPL